MRGQFFVISSIIIMTAMVLIIQYLHDFSKTDLATIAELRETDYVQYTKDALTNSASGPCITVDAELNATENMLKKNLAERGIMLTTFHSKSASTVNLQFDIKTPRFSSHTAFAVTCA